MAKVNNFIPQLLIDKLNLVEAGHTIAKGAIFYHSIECYKKGQAVIKRLGKQLPAQGYSKYGNKKVKLVIHTQTNSDSQFGLIPTYSEELITFDSEDEADYYFCLKDKFDAGEIKKVTLHPSLELFPAFIGLDGVKKNHIIYTPDFYVEYTDGRKEYVDVKGMSTEAGDLRRKLYDYLAALTTMTGIAGIPLRWVASSWKYGDKDGWISYDTLQQIRAKNRKEKKKGA